MAPKTRAQEREQKRRERIAREEAAAAVPDTHSEPVNGALIYVDSSDLPLIRAAEDADYIEDMFALDPTPYVKLTVSRSLGDTADSGPFVYEQLRLRKDRIIAYV